MSVEDAGRPLISAVWPRRRVQRGEALLQKASLGAGAGERQCAAVGGGSIGEASHLPEQRGARRMQQVRLFELTRFDDLLDGRQTGTRTVRHADRDGAVQLDHRRRRHRLQHAVQRDDLRPVRGVGHGGGRVQRSDRRLHLVGARSPHRQRSIDERRAGVDLLVVPPCAVLVGHQHEVAVLVEPGVAAAVVQQHHREQADDLGFAGQQVDEHSPEPDRLCAQLLTDERIAGGGRVPLVEHEVHGVQHRRQPFGQTGPVGNDERDAGGPDLPLRPDEPLCHRRLFDEEGPRDLGACSIRRVIAA